MFLVFNKEKIISYIIVLCTVILLFSIALNIEKSNVISVSSNVINQNSNNTTNTLNNCNIVEIEYKN